MVKTTVYALLAVILAATLFTGCANYNFAETGSYIVSAKDALSLAGQGAVLVDARSPEEYALSHVEGAVNIPMGALVVNEPYSNMLPEDSIVEEVMGAAGIGEGTDILVYDDNNNMMAARVQWTLNVYNNFNVSVVSGGWKALKNEGARTTSEPTVLDAAEYEAGDVQKTLVVNLDYVKSLINMPDENTVIIDTRSTDEFYAGTIPGSVHIEYLWNNYSDGEYKSIRDIQLVYLEKKILPDMKIILFCKTSVRAAQTYAALKNAGYKDVRIYDGAWLEYEDVENPQVPAETVRPTNNDAS